MAEHISKETQSNQLELTLKNQQIADSKKSFERLIELLKSDNLNYENISFYDQHASNFMNDEEKKAELYALLSERAINNETFWLMAVLRCEDLLIKTFQKSIEKGELIDLDFTPAVNVIRTVGTVFYYIITRKLKQTIKFMLNNFDKFTQPNWNFELTEGFFKGVTLLWLLAKNGQWEIFEYLLTNQPEVITERALLSAPTAGMDKDESLLLLLVMNKHWDLFEKLLKQHPDWVSKWPWNIPIYRGQSLLWMLVDDDSDKCIEKLLMDHPKIMPILNWQFVPKEGIYQGLSLLWLLAKNGRWELFEYLLTNHPKLISEHKMLFAPTEGWYKGQSLLLLVTNKRLDLFEMLLKQHPEWVSKLPWNVSFEQGIFEGQSLLWMLVDNGSEKFIEKLLIDHPKIMPMLDWQFVATGGHYADLTLQCLLVKKRKWALFEYLLNNRPEVITEHALLHAPAEGWLKDQSLFSLLVDNKRWDLLDKLLNQNPKLISKLPWNDCSELGIYKNLTLLQSLVLKKQWSLVRKFLEQDLSSMLELVWDGNISDFKPLWEELKKAGKWSLMELIAYKRFATEIHLDLSECENEERKRKIAYTYLLANLKDYALGHQDDAMVNYINITFESAVVALQNERMVLEREIPGVAWEVLKTSFDDYVKQRPAKFKIYAYRAVAYHSCVFWNKNSSNIQINAQQVEGWLNKINENEREPKLLLHDEREKIIAALNEQASLTEATVRYAFYSVFKPKPFLLLYQSCCALKKTWDFESQTGSEESRTSIKWLDDALDNLLVNPSLNLIDEISNEISGWLLKNDTQNKSYYYEVVSNIQNIIREISRRGSRYEELNPELKKPNV